jgi:hypothetical protein
LVAELTISPNSYRRLLKRLTCEEFITALKDAIAKVKDAKATVV